MNVYRRPHTDLNAREIHRLSGISRDQFLWLVDVTRQYGPRPSTRPDSLSHEAELFLYLWRSVLDCLSQNITSCKYSQYHSALSIVYATNM